MQSGPRNPFRQAGLPFECTIALISFAVCSQQVTGKVWRSSRSTTWTDADRINNLSKSEWSLRRMWDCNRCTTRVHVTWGTWALNRLHGQGVMTLVLGRASSGRRPDKVYQSVPSLKPGYVG